MLNNEQTLPTQTQIPLPATTETGHTPIDLDAATLAFMDLADNYLDVPVTMPNDQTQYTIYDAVRVVERDPDGRRTGNSEPVVMLQTIDGSSRTMNTRDFLASGVFGTEDLELLIQASEAKKWEHERQEVGSVAVVEHFSDQNSDAVKEDARQTHNRRLFAPIETEELGVPEDSFDDLFSDNYDPAAYTVEDAAVRSANDRAKITETTEARAVTTIQDAMIADKTLMKLIGTTQTISKAELPKLLRTNAQLREQVGTYLLSKIERPDIQYDMPERIVRDTQKAPSHPGYGHLNLRSKEYAVLLALSMLDGSFDYDRNPHDTITYNPDTKSGLGQHRSAAQILLSRS